MSEMIKVTYKIDAAPKVLEQIAACEPGHFRGECFHFRADDIRIVAKRLDEHLSIHAGMVHPEGLYVVNRIGTTDEELCVLDFQISSNNKFVRSDYSSEKIIYGSYISDSHMQSTVDYEKRKLTKYLTVVVNKNYLKTEFNQLENQALNQVLERNQFFVYNQMDTTSNIEINALVHYLFSGVALNEKFIQGSVFKILSAFADRFTEDQPIVHHAYDIEQLSYAKHFMDANPDKKIVIRDLAEMTAMSESKFRKLFRELYGVSPTAYKKNRKLLYAKELIESGEKISNVVFYIGFVNHSYFTRIFKKMFGVTPTEYQQLGDKTNYSGRNRNEQTN